MAGLAVSRRRPKNLDLKTIRLPLPGVLSIIHRVSGAGLFLMLPALLWLLQASLESPESYVVFQAVVAHPFARIVGLGLLWFYLHHFCAGIRYLLLDLHVGVELEAARRSSKIVFAVSIALTLLVAARLSW